MKFDKSKHYVCPKCGSKEYSLKYHPAWAMTNVFTEKAYPEFMEVLCETCGYNFREETL